jgi:hypothetical protein
MVSARNVAAEPPLFAGTQALSLASRFERERGEMVEGLRTPALDIDAARGSRTKHMAVGALAGAAVGLGLIVYDQSRCKPKNEMSCGLGVGTQVIELVGGGALVGGIIGRVWPADH